MPEWFSAPRSMVEDFVPWVSPISKSPLAREKEEEEKEDEMADLIHNFTAQKSKRGARFKRATDAFLEVAGEVNQ